jgi:S-adenosylmethionine:tRNA ribosyltransferase-isomerase
MKLSDFAYYLPSELIAQKPIKPRDHSRLLILDKTTGHIADRHFYEIADYLKKGDLLILNNSKVFPARLIGRKKVTGGKIEVFLLRKARGAVWQCLLGGGGRKENLEIEFAKVLRAKVIKNCQDGTWEVRFDKTGGAFMDIVNRIGLVPLPPYIKRATRDSADKAHYQTVYADNHKVGSVAAPTAGLHFTPRLMKKLKSQGVEFVYITLHVGLGTFAPVKIDDIAKHKMHSEWMEVNENTLSKIIQAKEQNRRVIAVGTTSARTLESIFAEFSISNFQFRNNYKIQNSKLNGYSGRTDIFIYPGYKFKLIDAMITNFHLPESTLLMLVSALAGKKNIDEAYSHAIKKKYRFYSYGDAMFIT